MTKRQNISSGIPWMLVEIEAVAIAPEE